jgi:hypothetical protein
MTRKIRGTADERGFTQISQELEFLCFPFALIGVYLRFLPLSFVFPLFLALLAPLAVKHFL